MKTRLSFGWYSATRLLMTDLSLNASEAKRIVGATGISTAERSRELIRLFTSNGNKTRERIRISFAFACVVYFLAKETLSSLVRMWYIKRAITRLRGMSISQRFWRAMWRVLETIKQS